MTEVQNLPFTRGFLELKKQWCKGCRLCADVCPKGIISVDELGKVQVDKPEECTGCGLCESICPDFAIRVKKNA